ncbi:SDR family NAD(P)-dependent oxidoreductase [Streptomyces brasiliensis]|uniref:Short-chain type dehydrogenase/reductase y4lA n=1 Tax=Streptomyces brasiliensis TaxID=1954 RepID=A0A917P040_9ACTN|nr:SDR family NAD(P)-dependent oxidoreductase [Streptomyces brasiliensis]GGJ41188.1 putative short-chain type dehydrogenase/reductase y4lA [Streptomyces brasiliensis]
MGSLQGRVALVTGAGSGMGQASAHALAAAGAKVMVTDVNGDTATATAKSITEAGGTAVAAVLDIAEEAAWREAVQTTRREFGAPVTVLHNNAALTGGPVMDRDRDPLNLDLDAWNTSLSITLTGAALGCKHVLPGMLEAGTGSIINMSSTRGVTGATWRMSYNTAKAGIIGLTRTVAVHYSAQGVRCNAIVPGVFDTPALRSGLPQERLREVERSHLLNRLGRPEEMANVVVFLASDLSAFITGAVIPVDGGQSAFSEGLAPAASRGIED